MENKNTQIFIFKNTSGMPVIDSDLENDLRNVAEQVGHKTITREIYKKYGKYHFGTIERRFGG